MTSQLCQNFQASQAVLVANDITASHFERQVNSQRVCGPHVDTLTYLTGLECPTLFSSWPIVHLVLYLCVRGNLPHSAELTLSLSSTVGPAKFMPFYLDSDS